MARAVNLKIRGRGLAAVLLAALALFSCDIPFAHTYRSLGGEWSRTDTLAFGISFEPAFGDSLELFAGVRYGAAYPYKDLWLLVEALSPDSGTVFLRDTICCAIYDSVGRRNGSTAGVLYQAEYYVASLAVPRDGSLDIRLAHLMSDSLLQGVFDVGVRFAPPGRHRCAGR